MFKALLLVLILSLSGRELKAAEEDNWQILISQVPQHYFLPISVEQNVVWLTKSLKALDENLTVADDDDKITLYYKGKVVKSLYKPEDRNNIDKWVELSGELLNTALNKSAIAAKHDFEVFDLMMAYYVKNLDKDSKYYSSINEMNRVLHQVNFASDVEDGYLWIRVGLFNKYTKEEIVKAIEKYVDVKGVILDLRASTGGELGTAIEVADLFLEDGIVVSVIGRNKKEITYYNSKDGDIAENLPMAVLVDGDTASAAEVLVAALQEQGRAKVIGTKTFGKGTIQNLIKLTNGGVLAVSNANFYTPSGRMIADKAIIPDICTFEMPVTKDVLRLIKINNVADCMPESRIDSDLEIKVAKELLKI